MDTNTPLKPEVMIEQLRAWQQQIPEFAPLPLDADPRVVSRINRLNPDFAQKALDAIDGTPILEQAIGRPAPELRQDLEDANRWTSVETELKTLLAGITAANRARRHRVGFSLLQAYHLSGRLAKQPSHSALAPVVREMMQTPKFGVRKRARAPETPPAPTPTPQPQK